jgi:hypothetical protein
MATISIETHVLSTLMMSRNQKVNILQIASHRKSKLEISYFTKLTEIYGVIHRDSEPTYHNLLPCHLQVWAVSLHGALKAHVSSTQVLGRQLSLTSPLVPNDPNSSDISQKNNIPSHFLSPTNKETYPTPFFTPDRPVSSPS